MDITTLTPPAPWRDRPFCLEWKQLTDVPRRVARPLGPSHTWASGLASPPWIDSGPRDVLFDFSRAIHDLMIDVCRHTPDLQHIDPARVLVTYLQARNARANGLQARVTPLRFPNGELVRVARGRLFQVQRFVVSGVEMLYVMTFCLPRYLDQTFDEKMITLFHELFHISTKFDGDLLRHRGRYCYHTASKSDYDLRMAEYARTYLATGANPQLHGFLRLNFGQLRSRHGKVIGHVVPRPRILPMPVEGT